MPKTKLRFGEVEADEGIPQMGAIKDQMEDNGLFGPSGDQHGVAMRSEGEEYVVGDDYIFIRYVQEIQQEQPEIDDGDVVMGENDIARTMRFLLTRDGTYAYESKQGVYDSDALEYLIGEDSFEIEFTCERYSRFKREQMNEFYEQAFRVRGLKVEDIGELEDSSVDSEIAEEVEEAGDQSVRAVFSSGQKDNDLPMSEIIDGFGRLSDVNYIRLRDSEGQISEINRNGRYTFSYPADLELEGQAERTKEIVSTLTDGLVKEEEEEE